MARKYNLRSTDFSSDDDAGTVTRVNQKSPTRMSLSESRFRRQLADIKKGNFPSPQRPTSTPQKAGSSPSPKSQQPVSLFKQPEPASTKVQAKTRLLFDSSGSKASSSVRKSSIVTRQQRRKLEEEITVAEQPPTVAEADDSETDSPPPAIKPQDQAKKPAQIETCPGIEEEQCFPMTWREFALAAFVTGLAAIGYVCYTTDYCGYC